MHIHIYSGCSLHAITAPLLSRYINVHIILHLITCLYNVRTNTFLITYVSYVMDILLSGKDGSSSVAGN